MFGTIIIDAYEENEVDEIIDALDDLCNPNDNYGWSSSGIYCFWDYYTKEIYYIGLASDLKTRFMQHNGIQEVDSNSCKLLQIKDYFSCKKKLGYTIFVQSPLSQPIVGRNKKRYKDFIGDTFTPIEDYAGSEGKEHMKEVEGILIEAYKKQFKKFPKWNKVGGSKYGQKSSVIGNYQIVKAFNTTSYHPLVSRSTLRELSDCPTYERYENDLHGIRMFMLSSGKSFNDSVNFLKNMNAIISYDELIKEKYLNKSLNI